MLFLLAPAAFGQIDPTAIVRQSIQNYERDWREAMTWEYQQTDVMRQGATKEINVAEVAPLGGTPYERLVMKDGQKLSPEQQKKEDRKYEKAQRQRDGETPQERLERIQKYEAERAFIKDIPNAYIYDLEGETSVNGRPAWIITLVPKPDFVPATPHAAMLSHIRGTLWIDKEDLQWAKAEADVIDTIEFGWIMARIGPGAHFSVEQTRVADGLWMPQKITIRGSARVLLVHTKVIDEELQFARYRKAGSPVNAQAAPPPKTPAVASVPQIVDSFR